MNPSELANATIVELRKFAKDRGIVIGALRTKSDILDHIQKTIIQQVNATDEHIESVIHFLKVNNIHARQVNLLPYHDIGKGKYASLDMEYHEDEMSVPVSELMEHFKSMFEEQGFNKVNIGG